MIQAFYMVVDLSITGCRQVIQWIETGGTGNWTSFWAYTFPESMVTKMCIYYIDYYWEVVKKRGNSFRLNKFLFWSGNQKRWVFGFATYSWGCEVLFSHIQIWWCSAKYINKYILPYPSWWNCCTCWTFRWGENNHCKVAPWPLWTYRRLVDYYWGKPPKCVPSFWIFTTLPNVFKLHQTLLW